MGLLNRIIIDDVLLDDQSGQEMLKVTRYPAYSLFQRSDKRLLLFCEQKYKIVRYES